MFEAFRRIPIFIILMILLSCRTGQRNSGQFSQEIYVPEYASGFRILGAEGSGSSIIAISNPWQSTEEISRMLFISRNGEKPPKGFQGEILKGDAERIVCMSSTYIAMLDAIGKVSTVTGVSGIDYISNPYIASHREKISDIGYDGNINYELLLSLEPDIVLLFGLNGANSIEPKLKELGIPFMYVGEYVEQSPLGKAEWIVALAEITGEREKGIEVFSSIPDEYDRLKKEVAAIKGKRPKVMINTPYRDVWYMPSTSSYMAKLIEDAGGEYIYRKNTSAISASIDMEEASLLTTEADVWINVGNVSSLSDLRNRFPKFADVPCVKAGAVYNCDKRMNGKGGNDFWESGVVNPEKILADLIKVFYPDRYENTGFTYYRRLE